MGEISCSWGSCDTTEGLLWEAVTCGEQYNTITLSVMSSVRYNSQPARAPTCTELLLLEMRSGVITVLDFTEGVGEDWREEVHDRVVVCNSVGPLVWLYLY